MSTPTTFTPAQKKLHDRLSRVDTKLLTIARTVMAGWLASGLVSGPDPKDLGAPEDTPAWTAMEDAYIQFEANATGDDEAIARAALDVTDDILAGRT